MKRTLLSTLAFTSLLACSTSKNSSMKNMVATMEVKEPIPGVCNNANVMVILPFPGNGQVKAQAPLSKAELAEKLNTEVDFLHDKPTYTDKGMVSLIVNCKGKMVRCQIDNKTQHPELDAQIVAVFATMKDWEAGTINGQRVDTSILYSFKIEAGKISL
jgi:DNA-binding protein YbaB